MSRTTRNSPDVTMARATRLTHAEIDRMLGEYTARPSKTEIARYWRTLDRALLLALRDPERSAYLASEARAIAVRIGRADLASNANEVASIVGGF